MSKKNNASTGVPIHYDPLSSQNPVNTSILAHQLAYLPSISQGLESNEVGKKIVSLQDTGKADVHPALWYPINQVWSVMTKWGRKDFMNTKPLCSSGGFAAWGDYDVRDSNGDMVPRSQCGFIFQVKFQDVVTAFIGSGRPLQDLEAWVRQNLPVYNPRTAEYIDDWMSGTVFLSQFDANGNLKDLSKSAPIVIENPNNQGSGPVVTPGIHIQVPPDRLDPVIPVITTSKPVTTSRPVIPPPDRLEPPVTTTTTAAPVTTTTAAPGTTTTAAPGTTTTTTTLPPVLTTPKPIIVTTTRRPSSLPPDRLTPGHPAGNTNPGKPVIPPVVIPPTNPWDGANRITTSRPTTTKPNTSPPTSTPTTTTRAPVTTTRAPVTTTRAPVTTTAKPKTINPKPTDTTFPPVLTVPPPVKIDPGVQPKPGETITTTKPVIPQQPISGIIDPFLILNVAEKLRRKGTEWMLGIGKARTRGTNIGCERFMRILCAALGIAGAERVQRDIFPSGFSNEGGKWEDPDIGFLTHNKELGDEPPYLAQLPTNESAMEHWKNIIKKQEESTDLKDGVHYWRANKRIEEFRDRKFLHK